MNKRTDEFGGTVEKRSTFLIETLKGIVDVWGPGRVGVRVSPSSSSGPAHFSGSQAYIMYGQTDDSDGRVYEHAIERLNAVPLAYMLITEPRWDPVR